MKKYNIENYVRWKNDVAKAISRLPEIDGDYTILNRDQNHLKCSFFLNIPK